MQLAQRFSSPSQAATMEGEGYALVACGLHKSYGSFTAVRGLSLALRSGECFGLLGVNGAGKSTTFQMLTGLLQPTGGDAFMKDACLSTNRTKWQSFIGYCPQASGLLDRLNAYECLWMYARLRGIPEAQIKAAVESAIELTDLEKHAHKNCGIYSGGNKRKLTIAVGILGNPRVVFLDEPYAGVDVVARTKIQRNMDRIRRNTNIPMVLTSHHMEDCEAACDRLCIMVAGQMTCLGTLQHLKDKFGKGYTMQLVLAPAARPSESGEGGPPAQMQGQELGAAVEKLFPGIKVLSAKDNVQDFHIRDVIPWSEIFRNIDKLEEKFTFSHVLVQDTNLEQLFIAFAQNKDTPQGA
ncbi:phospholipid-transporting ATPase ABCA3-like [Haemaphysalis longicornis]